MDGFLSVRPVDKPPTCGRLAENGGGIYKETKNKADTLTRVPKKWLSPDREHLVCGAADTVTPEEITTIHETSGHPGIRRTLYFCKKLFSLVQRQQVCDVVQECR
ncbi:hypothetical protein E2C01_100194 [Portunus trituberculatus]|uniref:Uncharacterized protein n=1 Tax=Portunus trituberculatus TaxID=210409 RepID=A0A5B7K645_PORTR|nr:hypothetical protein [Portunus trituberculatus]